MAERALFMDRDGVVNLERHYVHRIEDFEFLEGIFDLCRLFQRAGYRLIIVTNQAGIARGYYSEAQFQSLTAWMAARFLDQGITIDGIYHCPYHPTAGIGDYRRESPDRKPAPGMLLRARRDFNLDMAQSVLIGDKPSDIQAGIAAGIGTNILISSKPEDSANGVFQCFDSLTCIRDVFLAKPGFID